MSSVRFVNDNSSSSHHRFPSSSSSSHHPHQLVLDIDRYPNHIRYLNNLSQDINTHPPTTTTNNNNYHHQHQHQQHQQHQLNHHHLKPRPSSISKIPQQHSLRTTKPNPTTVRPRTQSLTEPSTTKLTHQRSWILPLNPLIHSSRTPSPSPSGSRHSISSIKKTLVETIDGFPCSLEDKLTLVAKLHAEVEAELTQLNQLDGNLKYGHSREKIQETIRFIKHADRIKAHAIQQLQHDITHSQSSSSTLHPTHPTHSHHSSHQPSGQSNPVGNTRLALLNRELH